MRYLLPLLFLFLLGCAASKKAEDVNPAPGWVKNRPVVEGHYIGIGSARKVGMKHEYVAEARRNALQDMASQISSRVSATSVLHTIEDAYGVSESFSERIEIESDSYLEGFEPVGYYESADQFWVYYRISQEEYTRNENRRKEEALQSALSKYRSASREAESHRPLEAIAFCLQGMEDLKGFLAEDLEVQTEQGSMDVGRDLLALMDEVASGLSLSAMTEQVEVKRGSSLPDPIAFRITYKAQPVSGVPVNLEYSGGYLKSSMKRTDKKGRVTVQPGRITSGKSLERMEAAIDHESIGAGAVSDLFIRSILKNIPSDKAYSNIDILSPVIALQVSSEGEMPGYDTKVLELCRRKAEQYHLTLSGSRQTPDYALHISYRLRQGETAGSLTAAYLTSELQLTDQHNHAIARAEIREVKGVGRTTPEAKEKAFQTFFTRLTRRSLDQLLNKHF